jgi:hypothetical protein
MGKVADLLVSELNYIYCHNCANQDNEDECDGCNRKSMNWELGQQTAEQIEAKIKELSE